MAHIVRYIHKLEQLTELLHESVVEVEVWGARLRRAIRAGQAAADSMRAAYIEFLSRSVAHAAVESLQELVAELTADTEIDDLTQLQADLFSANERTLRLCQLLLDNTQLLIGS